MKSLATILLANFDKRYHPPAGNVGKVRFSPNPETGKGNRYTGAHPYLLIAAYLDPRTKKALKKMMVTDQYQEMRTLILNMLIQVAIKKEMQMKVDDRQGDNSDNIPDNCPPGEAKSHLDCAFEGLYDNDSESEQKDQDAIDENSIRVRCVHQLVAYDLVPSVKMKDSNGNYNNPLKVWKECESQSPELSQLAVEFLSILATSAPSERVFSRASRVISAKRARLNPEVTARMIFAQENVKVIHDHWKELLPDIPLLESYLPLPFKDVDEEGKLIDVGQDDFK